MKRFDLPDLLLLAGAACIVCGVAQVSIPAAWIAAGIFMIAFAYLIAKERVNNASSTESGKQ